MKDIKLHTYVSLLFSFLFFIASVVTISFLIKNEAVQLLDTSINSLKNEADIIAKMTAEAINLNLPKEKLGEVLQSTIENTETDKTFISIINWTGDFVCYPDITKVGLNASKKNSIDYEQGVTGFKLYDYLKKNDILYNENLNDEIINLHTIDNSDLLITCHIKTNEINIELNKIKTRIYLTFLVFGFILLLLLNAMIRIVCNYYNKQLESKILELEFNAKNLAELNDSFKNYQKRILNNEKELTNTNTTVENTTENTSKERFLTYVRNELVSISTKDISYIYVENTITYIIRKDGKLSTSNETLDKIYNTLDQKVFFKVNRQFIISISAIKKIERFENSKLKLDVNPTSEIDIIIGKNKASSFKQWLDL